MKTAKKFIALLLGAIMMLGMLAGCGNTASAPQQTKAPAPSIPVLSGMVVLSARASFKISYDQDGMVMELSGANEEGNAIVAEYKDFTGKSCSTVAKELIAATAKATLLREANVIVLKLATGSQLPSETFLDAIAKDVTAAAAENASSAPVLTIDLAQLDAEGYINVETAKILLQKELGTETFEAYNCDSTPRNDAYTAYVTVNGESKVYLIDAVTGLITETVVDESLEDEYIEEPEFDETFEENIDEVTDEYIEDEFVEETTPTEEPTV